jgi:hypothetical protein
MWADYWNPNEFSDRGGQVSKRPLHHADPWVLENLRRIRRELYPGARLAELLQSSADLPSGAPRGTLHREAMEALRDRVQALRRSPSRAVQDELDELTALLAELERRLEDPATPLDETRFQITTADRAPGVESGEIDVAAYGELVDQLTAACQECHVVDRATIQRVQKDQRSLLRAEFDHGAHVIHASCLDCHDRIPVREYVEKQEEAPPELDRADIVNLPTLENCRSCHESGAAGAQCITCHQFHPESPALLEPNRFGG